MKGTLCFSLDTELIWGRVHLENVDLFDHRAQKEWAIIPKILALFDKYNIPATWAVTGHMMLSSCKTENGVKHPELVRPNYPWLSKDWFLHEPMTNETSDPAWYGLSLFQQIKRYKYHEIASHTYAHFFWGMYGFSKASATSDIKAWEVLAKKHRVKAKTIIFPKNSVNYLPLLYRAGFINYRGEDVVWYKNTPKMFHKIIQIVDFILPISPNTSIPHKVSMMINIPGCYYFLSARGIRKYIPRGFRAYKAKMGINKAIKNGQVFHLWTHPIDFSDNTNDMLSDFEEILKFASQKRAEGVLEILTMADVGKKYLQ